MLSLLFLVTVASAGPVVKLMPLFEDITALRHKTADPLADLRAWCVDDCHHHILNKPVFIMARADDDRFTMHYAPAGLNNLVRSPLTAPVHNFLANERRVGVIFPFAKFPSEFFPGVLDTEFVIPEHQGSLNHMYREAPIMAVFSEEEFLKFNEKKGYKQVADMAIGDNGYSIAKDYAHINRNVPLLREETSSSSPWVYLVSPSVSSVASPFATATSSLISPADLYRAVSIPHNPLIKPIAPVHAANVLPPNSFIIHN